VKTTKRHFWKKEKKNKERKEKEITTSRKLKVKLSL
jgi:hypothetical protein